MSSLFEDDIDLPTIPGLSRLTQGLNIYETDDAVIAEAALPGVPEEDIDVSVENGIVRITGSREETKEERGQRNLIATLASSYNYSFRLPEGVVTDQEPEATLEDGILRLTFRKIEKAPPKKITIKRHAKKESNQNKQGK